MKYHIKNLTYVYDISYICLLFDYKYMTDCRQNQPYLNRVSKDALKKLKEELPRGYGAIIRNKLIKLGKDYSRSMIERVLNPDDDRYNELIIEVAIQVRNEFREYAKTKTSEMEQEIILNPSI